MGVPGEVLNVELTGQTNSSGCGWSSSSCRNARLLSWEGTAPWGVREIKAGSSVAAVAKLKRARPLRGVEQQHNQQSHARQRQQHHQALIPVINGSLDGSSLEAPILPLLVDRQHTGKEPSMRQNPAHGRGPSATPKGGVCQVYPHALVGFQNDGDGNTALVERCSQESVVPRKADGERTDHDRHLDAEQEVIRRGLDDLLARPAPSFDYVHPDGGEGQFRDSSPQQGVRRTSPSTLPELFLSRRGNRDDGNDGDEGGYLRGTEASQQEEGLQTSRTTTDAAVAPNVTASERRRMNKPTRSQSGGLFRPPLCSSVGSARGGVPMALGHQNSVASGSTTSSTVKNATVAAFFKGEDAVLLDQAFAFADTVAREEEAEAEVRLARRGGRRQGRGGGGSAARLSLDRGGDRRRLRRTRSSGSSVILSSGGDSERSRGESGGRVEVEDWVRGLPHSAPVATGQLKRQQSARSINQGSTQASDIGGGQEMERRQAAGRRKKLVVGSSRRRQEAESGGLRFDRRRDKEESKKMAETAEMVKRFEAGTGVAALRAELEESRASMRRSAEAIEQVASRWHQQRSIPA